MYFNGTGIWGGETLLILNNLIINNNVFPIEIIGAFAKKPLGIKGLNMFSKLLGVVYIALLTTKLFKMVYYKRKSS